MMTPSYHWQTKEIRIMPPYQLRVTRHCIVGGKWHNLMPSLSRRRIGLQQDHAVNVNLFIPSPPNSDTLAHCGLHADGDLGDKTTLSQHHAGLLV